MSFRFQFRRGTTAERNASNPILAAGEPAVVLDSGQPAELVLGDGVTAMADLRAAVWDDDARLSAATTAVQPSELTKAAVGLPNADNTADVDKPARTAATGLRASLSAGITTGYSVLGDSTSNETVEWAYLLGQTIAAAHPEYTVEHVLWSAGDMAAPVVVQTGTAGVQYLDTSTSIYDRSLSLSASPHTVGVVDVRAKVSLPDWTPTAIALIVAREGGAGKRSWYFGVSTTGKLGFWYSVDGSALVSDKLSSVAVPAADGATMWVRAVYTPSASVMFYTSTDGNTWTQLGTTLAHTDGALFNAATPYELGGRQGATQSGVCKIYRVDVRDGLSGTPIVPCLPALWGATEGTAATVVGAPTLTIVNGSHPGAGLAYWTDAFIAKASPACGQRVAFVSLAHNELVNSGPEFAGRYAALLGLVRAHAPGVPIVCLTQSPQKSPRAAGFIAAQAARRVDIQTVAPTMGAASIDTHQAFLDAGLATTVQDIDGVHPTNVSVGGAPTGSQVWCNTVLAAIGL